MTVPFQPLLLLRSHNNQQLFSDHYLDVNLPKRDDWQALAGQAEPVMRAIADVLAKYQPSNIEAQVEDQLIRPILALLGHKDTYEVQASLKTPEGIKRPDYIFYRDVAALNANKDATLTDDLLRQGAFAVGDAKYWDCPLDRVDTKRGGGNAAGHSKERNPSAQIAFYIQHTALDWGILTNGRKWRLYHKSSSYKLDRFYEVDLPELVQSGDPLKFLYFFAFFNRAAFDVHPLSLASILDQSAEYARGVGDTLKTQVYEALRHLAQGFLDYTPNNLPDTPETRKEIYDASLIVLYRMLFVLYAEARNLLPLYESASYRTNYSFKAIKEGVARDLDMGAPLLADSATLWPRLKTLSSIINTGSPPLHVATFNGGLFDSKKHTFLESYSVGDGHLQRAVDKLARVDGQFVDYRDLAVRHLGTIYEGLLEYHLEPIEASGGWSIDLLNDKGERKATGSYYTPDYIVKYIVEQTLGPVLEDAVRGLEDDAAKAGAVLACNVLDPAMGSGHFLVEATDYIARFLVDIGINPPGSEGGESGQGDTDLASWRRRVAQSCIYGVDLNPLAVELAKLSLWLATVAKDRPLSFLDHHLRAGNSLVGARLADLRIETGAGNGSKSNARKKASKKAQEAAQEIQAGQRSMLDDAAFTQAMSGAVGSMWDIEENPGLTVGQVKEQEAAYSQLRESMANKYGRLADFVTATHFGLKADVTGEQWHALADYATGRSVAAPAQFVRWLEDADAIAKERRFFHWELEFPEVFFDRQGQPLGEQAGFDAVIGNPPYIRQEQLTLFKPYLANQLPQVYHGTADIFVYFIGGGIAQLRTGGLLSYISSNSWLRANYATPLRAYLRKEAVVEQIIDLGDNRVFADAPDVYPAILVARRQAPTPDQDAQVAVFTRRETLTNFDASVALKLLPVAMHDQDDAGWQLGSDSERLLFKKLMAVGRPLGEVVKGQMYRGVLTGLNEAFIIDRATRDRLVQGDPNCAEIIKPLVNGEDIKSWYVEDEGRFLILLPDGWTVKQFGKGLTEAKAWSRLEEKYPHVAYHLEPHMQKAKARSDKGAYWWELRPCTYYADFDSHKIFWPEMSKLPRFTLAEPGIVGNKTTFMIPGERPYLLGILMSRAIWFAITKLCVPIGERKGMLRYTLSGQFMERLPIPNSAADEHELISAIAREITAQANTRYSLHQNIRQRIIRDLGTSSRKLNQKLTSWWELDFPTFRAEIQKVFKHDIPLRERTEWEQWLTEQQVEHRRLTAEIVRLETELDARIYKLFNLTLEEITLIEQSTRYRYGEV